MQIYDGLEVFLNDDKVGTLVSSRRRHLVSFSYDKAWLANGFSISPFSLPLKSGIFVPETGNPFEGLFGVFSDSLPDGWGRLLVDRLLRRNGVDPLTLDPLNRLAIVGMSGMGALRYVPSHAIGSVTSHKDFDEIAQDCSAVLASETEGEGSLDDLFALGGSSGGARPKALVNINDKACIVKFRSSYDPRDIGLQEYRYMECANECGISVPGFSLIPSRLCDGYFAVERFDRKEGKAVHMVSVSGLLETSHRIPNLDYSLLMLLVMKLSGASSEIEEMFRRMCFNVFSHNRDDHSKNFSFLCRNGIWTLSPAYDMTYSSSIGGEHATTVNGKGKDISINDLVYVGTKAGIPKSRCCSMASEIRSIVQDRLEMYL